MGLGLGLGLGLGFGLGLALGLGLSGDEPDRLAALRAAASDARAEGHLERRAGLALRAR